MMCSVPPEPSPSFASASRTRGCAGSTTGSGSARNARPSRAATLGLPVSSALCSVAIANCLPRLQRPPLHTRGRDRASRDFCLQHIVRDVARVRDRAPLMLQLQLRRSPPHSARTTSSATESTTRLLISSAIARSFERSPASTCTIGMRICTAASAQPSVLFVSPMTTTARGRRRLEHLRRACEHVRRLHRVRRRAHLEKVIRLSTPSCS